MTKLNTFLAAIPLLMATVLTHAEPTEAYVEAPGPTGPLKGVMLSPNAPSKAVALIIPGSGPTDRDGNNPLGIRASTYKLLAQDLAARGLTTVRADKRGMFASAAATPDPNAVTIRDYVDDVNTWVGVSRKLTGANCVWLIGHSEGGLVAMAASNSQPGICGLVLIAAAGRPLGEVLREQIKANPANVELVAQSMSAIDSLEKGRRVDTASLHPALQGLFASQVQGFLISEFSYDPRRLLADEKKPALVLQGKRDIQVGEADALLLKQAAPHAALAILPDVNHVLKSVASDEMNVNLATYADPSLPLAPDVGRVIAEFITRESKVH